MQDAGIIKAPAARVSQSVRPFLSSASSGNPEASNVASAVDSPSPEPLSPMVALMEKLALCEAEISNHQAELDKAYARGVEEGRAAAEDAFEEDRAEGLALLRTALENAHSELQTRLEGVDRIAQCIGEACLTQMIGVEDIFRPMLAQAIGTHVKRLEQETVLSVAVARVDFPDTREVAAVLTGLGLSPDIVEVSDDLDSGQCRIGLRIGQVELDLQRHRDAIAAIFSEPAGWKSE